MVSSALANGSGVISKWFPDRLFGFVKQSGGEDIFFHGKDFNGHGQQPCVGMEVMFQIRDSYDTAKGRSSHKAVKVTPSSKR